MILWRGEGAKAVASTHGERPGSTHKVVEVQCSRNTTLDPEQPHAWAVACRSCVLRGDAAAAAYTCALPPHFDAQTMRLRRVELTDNRFFNANFNIFGFNLFYLK